MISVSTSAPLPNSDQWSFLELASSPDHADRERVARLERAGSPATLIHALTDALTAGVASGDIRYGWGFKEADPSHHRAVVQFRVDPTLFDWFFNARSGYRAHFRAHPSRGIALNADLVGVMQDKLHKRLPVRVSAMRVDSHMTSHGDVGVSRVDFISSLNVDLPKLWLGATPIGGGYLPTAASGPKICVGSKRWYAFYMGDNAWLDLKGAFNANNRLCQPKDPLTRALKLHETGNA